MIQTWHINVREILWANSTIEFWPKNQSITPVSPMRYFWVISEVMSEMSLKYQLKLHAQSKLIHYLLPSGWKDLAPLHIMMRKLGPLPDLNYVTFNCKLLSVRLWSGSLEIFQIKVNKVLTPCSVTVLQHHLLYSNDMPLHAVELD